MLWLLRVIFKIIMLASIVLIVVVAGVVLFVSPNNFKSEINEYLHGYTGYAIEVQGAIRWSFKPQLALHFQDVVLAGPAGFKTSFVTAKEAHVYIESASIFSDTLIISKLEIKDLTATIEQQASGVRNIDGIAPSTQTSKRKAIIKEVALENSAFILQNDQNNQHWALNNAALSTKNLTLNPISKLDTIGLKGALTNLDSNISFNLETVLSLDTDKQTLSFDPLSISLDDAKLHGKSVVSQYNTNPAVTGDLTLDPLELNPILTKLMPNLLGGENVETIKKIGGQASFNYISQSEYLEFPSLNIQLDDGSLTGDCKMTLTGPYKANFNLNLDHINLQPILNMLVTLLPAPTEAETNSTIPVELLTSLSIDGKIAGSAVKIGAEFLIDHMTIEVSAQEGILQLNPITLSAYEGGHNCSIALDVTKATPVLKIVEQANNVALEPWLKLFNLPNTLLGNAEVKISLDAAGSSFDGFKQTMEGGANFMVKKGSVFGLDVDKLLEYTGVTINDIYIQLAANKGSDLATIIKPKANDWISTQKTNPTTAFDTLELKVEMKQGISNSSVSMVGTNYELKGTGGFDLTANKVNFNLLVKNKVANTNAVPELAAYLAQNQLGLGVTGSPDKMIFTPDLQNYFTNGIKQTQTAVMKRAVTKMVNSAGPSAKTSKSAGELFLDSLKGLK